MESLWESDKFSVIAASNAFYRLILQGSYLLLGHTLGGICPPMLPLNIYLLFLFLLRGLFWALFLNFSIIIIHKAIVKATTRRNAIKTTGYCSACHHITCLPKNSTNILNLVSSLSGLCNKKANAPSGHQGYVANNTGYDSTKFCKKTIRYHFGHTPTNIGLD
jgi:hypothetical protein